MKSCQQVTISLRFEVDMLFVKSFVSKANFVLVVGSMYANLVQTLVKGEGLPLERERQDPQGFGMQTKGHAVHKVCATQRFCSFTF